MRHAVAYQLGERKAIRSKICVNPRDHKQAHRFHEIYWHPNGQIALLDHPNASYRSVLADLALRGERVAPGYHKNGPLMSVCPCYGFVHMWLHGTADRVAVWDPRHEMREVRRRREGDRIEIEDELRAPPEFIEGMHLRARIALMKHRYVDTKGPPTREQRLLAAAERKHTKEIDAANARRKRLTAKIKVEYKGG